MISSIKCTELSPPLTAIDAPARPHSRGWGGVLAIAFVLRLLACWVWADDLTQDRDAYLGIARNIASGNGFCSPDTTTPTAFRPPVLPILLGLLQLAVPVALSVALVNVSAGMATVGAVWVLVEKWWSPPRWKTAAAALAIAADPLLLRYTAQPMTECLFTALVAWTLVGITALRQNPQASLRTAWLTGIVAGLGALCRPTIDPYLGFVAVGLLWVAWRSSRDERRYRLRQIAAYSISVAALLAIWAGRNAAVLGAPLLTTTHGGYTLLLGNNPVFYDEVVRQPWGTVWCHDSLIAWQTGLAEDLRSEVGPTVDEITADRWHAQRAWQAMDHDPAGFRGAVWYRIRSFWSLAPRGPERNSAVVTGLVAVWYAALFLFAAAGFAAAVLRRHFVVVIGGGLIVTVAALHLLYWTDTRMRCPLHPVLIVFAAGVPTINRRRSGCA